MANVLNVFGVREIDRLQRLSDDLEEILLSLAYNGKAIDRLYIEANQKYIKRKYGAWVASLAKDVTTDPYSAESGIGMAVASVVGAYYGFLEDILFLMKEDRGPRKIEEEAKDILYECLIFPEDMKEQDLLGAA